LGKTLDLGISLHANKISIVLAINARGALSSTEISQHIGISRQLIESRLKSSVEDGFFIQSQDPRDSRKKIYDISEGSRAEAARIVSIMTDFETVYATLWAEIGVDLEAGLKSMEWTSFISQPFDYRHGGLFKSDPDTFRGLF